MCECKNVVKAREPRQTIVVEPACIMYISVYALIYWHFFNISYSCYYVFTLLSDVQSGE